MRHTRFWATLILSSLTIVLFTFLLWELMENSLFEDLDYKTLHYLYITRGITVSLLLACWAAWFVWKEKLKHQERLDKIINNSTDAILVYDETGQITAFNKTAESLFCDNRKRVKTVWDIVPYEKRVDFSKRLENVKNGEKVINYETERLFKDGKKFPVSIGLIYVKEDGRFVETIRDIRESLILRNKIIDLEKAQIFGKMAEGIAHHLGTPLASMLLRVQMLKEDMPEHADCSNCLEKLDLIERQIFYGQKVIQKLLRFVRRSVDEKQPEIVSHLLEDGIEIMKPILKKQGIELELRLEDEDLKILADKDLLALVFADTMMNSVDAMPQGGKLSIFVSRKSPERRVEIKMADTGVGIPRDVLPLIFEPFFTTKPAGKGTGLGLSLAKRIIKDHGGEIGVESIEGQGTTILIRLPIYEQGQSGGEKRVDL
ncbi:MAG TPA: ATP-binding protein [Thermodesulfobacteriota bacterium]|nr:ATP-binding protein [Thermodesulfobacteriota bacterium]